jgi:two-component system chemotaxis response regulator CheB
VSGNDSSQHDPFSIIVIGAPADGVETLTQLVKLLPRELNAAVLVLLHFPSYGKSVLPTILSRAGTLPAKHPEDGEALRSRHIYVAPPDYRLVIEPDRVRLSHSPKENGHRPAIDPLFRSAAMAYQKRVIGVILTGLLDDGTAGLAMIKQKGGIAIAQDPEEAMFNGMPTSAIANVAVDYVLPVAEIASVLVERSNNQTSNRAMDNKRDPEVEIIRLLAKVRKFLLESICS